MEKPPDDRCKWAKAHGGCSLRVAFSTRPRASSIRPARTAGSAAIPVTRCGAFRSCASRNRSDSASMRFAPRSPRSPTIAPPMQMTGNGLSTSWRPRIDHQIAMLERLRDRLHGCHRLRMSVAAIMPVCSIRADEAALRGPGPPLHHRRRIAAASFTARGADRVAFVRPIAVFDGPRASSPPTIAAPAASKPFVDHLWLLLRRLS